MPPETILNAFYDPVGTQRYKDDPTGTPARDEIWGGAGKLNILSWKLPSAGENNSCLVSFWSPHGAESSSSAG